MKLARLQVDELAAPVLALLRDGAYYDVATLEERWQIRDPARAAGSFHGRVVASRCSGLDQLDARLASGHRPTEARLLGEQLMPLAPCTTERGAYLQLPPIGAAPVAGFERRDRRALLGDGQPVLLPVPVAEVGVEVGLAALLADDLHHADRRQARRALIGLALLLDWGAPPDWRTPRREPYAASQLGPALVVGASMRPMLAKELRVVRPQGSAVRLSLDIPVTERVAALSRCVPLYAGDLIGLGCLPGGRLLCRYGELLSLQLKGVPPLRGWALPAR